MHINKKFHGIDNYLIDIAFIQDSLYSDMVLKHDSKQDSVMRSINNPSGSSLNFDNTKVDLISIDGAGHVGLIASVLLLALALPFFLLYSFFALSSMSHQTIIAVTIGYRALVCSSLNTSHAFKNSEI